MDIEEASLNLKRNKLSSWLFLPDSNHVVYLQTFYFP